MSTPTDKNFDTWWQTMKACGDDYLHYYDWKLSHYEYHSIDLPMEEAFVAGATIERNDIVEMLKTYRRDHLAPCTEAGEVVSSLIVQIACRGFDPE